MREILYAPDRLKYPMKRAGERGEGKWERIAWDEALTTIANRLNEIKKKYGLKQYKQAPGNSDQRGERKRSKAHGYQSQGHIVR